MVVHVFLFLSLLIFCVGVIAYVDVRSGRKSCINTSQSISHSLTALGASVGVCVCVCVSVCLSVCLSVSVCLSMSVQL